MVELLCQKGWRILYFGFEDIVFQTYRCPKSHVSFLMGIIRLLNNLLIIRLPFRLPLIIWDESVHLMKAIFRRFADFHFFIKKKESFIVHIDKSWKFHDLHHHLESSSKINFHPDHVWHGMSLTKFFLWNDFHDFFMDIYFNDDYQK